MNSIEPTIQFTIESEGTLPFLDTWITHHSDGTITTTVFQKKTHTDWYLDFESHHPLVRKAAVACTLFSRADKICTDIPEKTKEKENVTADLRMNGYPREVVTKNWEPSAHPQQPEESDTPKAKLVLLYVWHLLETIRRILSHLGIHTSFRPHQTLCQTLVHLKDHIHPRQHAGVVYQTPCGRAARSYTLNIQEGHWTIA